MNILGVVAHTLGYGDAGAALSVNGKIVGLIEEERFTRKRYDDSFPAQSIKELLSMGGIKGSDVDIVSLHLSLWRGLGNRLYWAMRHPFSTLKNYGDYSRYALKYGSLKQELQEALGSDHFRMEYYPHHPCHAATSFYSSPFDSAAILTIDGSGEGVTSTLGTASRKNGLSEMTRSPYPHSLGIAYSAVSDHLGFPLPAGPSKVMGLAAYGDPRRFMPLMKKAIQCKDGKIHLDLSYFVFHKNLATPLSIKPWVSTKFEKEAGLARRQKSDELLQVHMDLSAAIQLRSNEVGTELASWLALNTKEKNLCLGGGVALNSVMNGVIEEAGIFENVFVHPAAGDAGNALGSIFLCSLAHGEKLPVFPEMPYAGPEYSDEEVEAALNRRNLTYRKAHDIAREAATAIKEGKVVGWFQKRMEVGPRALGCRSILADPGRKEMLDHINHNVKEREWFRPLAPSVTREAYKRYFSGSEDNAYMLKVSHVKEAYRATFPAITHVDGTSRVQSVTKESNALYHRMLENLEELTGHPVVLNTSFNKKAPIVCDPDDALDCFLNAKIDRLCIGNFVVDKR